LLNMSLPPLSRQPERQPWALEALIRERALAMSRSLDITTRHTYASALNSWLAFINMHNFNIEPTPGTLSYFVVYMSHQISPRSVKSYLSGLVQQLEPDFPNIRDVCGSRLVTRTIKGCLKMLSKPVRRKDPLSIDDLQYLQTRFHYSQNHNAFFSSPCWSQVFTASFVWASSLSLMTQHSVNGVSFKMRVFDPAATTVHLLVSCSQS
jgi:hypothetical protein